MSRRRGSSLGKLDFGDTQGSSLTTARVENSRHARRMTRSRQSGPASSDFTVPAAADAAASSVSASDLKNEVGNKEAKQQKSTPLSVFLHLSARNTWFGPGIVLAFFYGWWFVSARNDPNHWLNACVKLSYPTMNADGSLEYGKGKRDFAFVAFHVIVFTFIREFCMQVALRPFARYFGIKHRHKVNRFLEQTYSMLYYGVMGPLGLYIMKYKCPSLWYFRTLGFYEGFPHKTHDVWFKAFYLLQASFWVQQALVLVLQLEKRRRDFHELVFHHVITVALIFLSYRFHFTRMGLPVYITMDISDFVLAASKTLNYLDSPAVVPVFATFVAAWTYLRHYINIRILISIWTEFSTVGPFDLNWETQQYKCWLSQYITFSLLFALQLVNIYWYILVLRIGYRYVMHSAREDVRSDDEDDEDEEES